MEDGDITNDVLHFYLKVYMKLSITHCITDDKFLDDAILMFDSIKWI